MERKTGTARGRRLRPVTHEPGAAPEVAPAEEKKVTTAAAAPAPPAAAEQKRVTGGSRSRGWFGTINYAEPGDHKELIQRDVDALLSLRWRYILVGKHIGEARHVEHIHFDIEFNNQTAFSTLKKAVPRADLETRRGTPEEAKAYILKPGSLCLVEKGDQPHQGNPFSNIFQAVADGSTFLEIAKEYPEQVFKYHAGIKAVMSETDKERQIDIEDYPLRPWQQLLFQHMQRTPDPRKVIWVYDKEGGAGKSWFCKWLAAKQGAQFFTNAKTADIARAIQFSRDPEHPAIICFNMTRKMETMVNYAIIEAVKDGMVFSSKYDSCSKIGNRPHVVVMANFMPDMSAMSADRWFIMDLSKYSIEQHLWQTVLNQAEHLPAGNFVFQQGRAIQVQPAVIQGGAGAAPTAEEQQLLIDTPPADPVTLDSLLPAALPHPDEDVDFYS